MSTSDSSTKLKSDYQKLQEDYNFSRKQNDAQLEKLSRAEG